MTLIRLAWHVLTWTLGALILLVVALAVGFFSPAVLVILAIAAIFGAVAGWKRGRSS